MPFLTPTLAVAASKHRSHTASVSQVVPRCWLALSTLGGIRTRALRLERPAATPQAYEGISGSGGSRTHSIPWFEQGWSSYCLPSQSNSGSWSRTNIVSFKARQPTVSRSPNHALKYDIPVSRILFEAIISLGTYQTVVALLTGWVHLACTLRGRAILRPEAFLCLVKQGCPDFPPARSRSAPAMARDVASRATKKARHLGDAWPLFNQGCKTASPAQTIGQQAAQALAFILAAGNRLERARHFTLSYIH